MNAATAMVFVFSLYSATPSMATVVFDDGGTHTINYAIPEDVVVTNGSTLDVKAPAQISGQVAFPVGSSGSTVNMSGGTITGGISSNAVTSEVNLNLSGTAVVMGGVQTQTGHISISDQAVVQGGITNASGGSSHTTSISGGLIEGGVFTELGELSISGGELRGAAGTDQGGTALSFRDSLTVNIAGGTLLGGTGGVNGGDALHVVMPGSSFISITGGEFAGGTGGSYGGTALFLQGHGSSDIISGGIFDAGRGGLLDGFLLAAFLDGWGPGPYELAIRGGLFGEDTVGQGFFLQDSILTVFGQPDLRFDGFRLSGTLLDGNLLDVPVMLGEGAQIVLAPVPEPSTLLLLGSGLVGLGGMAWRRRDRA